LKNGKQRFEEPDLGRNPKQLLEELIIGENRKLSNYNTQSKSDKGKRFSRLQPVKPRHATGNCRASPAEKRGILQKSTLGRVSRAGTSMPEHAGG